MGAVVYAINEIEHIPRREGFLDLSVLDQAREWARMMQVQWGDSK